MLSGGDKVSAAAPPASGTGTMALPTDVPSGVHQAQLLRTSGDLNGALHLISQLMLVAPDDARVVGEYGKLLVQQGRSDDATQFLRRAVELAPTDWSVYSALGVAYDQLNDATDAKLAYEHALLLKPGEPAILNNYGMSRMLAGDTQAARALMLQAKASGSKDPKIDSNLALLDSSSPAPAKPVTAALAPAPHVAAETPAVSHLPTPVTVKSIAPVAVVITPAVKHAAAAVTAKSNAPVATASVPGPKPVVAVAAPTPIIRNGMSVIMQEVPVDPKAGRVAVRVAPTVKIAQAGQPVAATVTAKPAKTAAKPLDHIPALRMTADAGKP
jgi:Flp pilus assembly protein TadD